MEDSLDQFFQQVRQKKQFDKRSWQVQSALKSNLTCLHVLFSGCSMHRWKFSKFVVPRNQYVPRWLGGRRCRLDKCKTHFHPSPFSEIWWWTCANHTWFHGKTSRFWRRGTAKLGWTSLSGREVTQEERRCGNHEASYQESSAKS